MKAFLFKLFKLETTTKEVNGLIITQTKQPSGAVRIEVKD